MRISYPSVPDIALVFMTPRKSLASLLKGGISASEISSGLDKQTAWEKRAKLEGNVFHKIK